MMRTSNPALNDDVFARARAYGTAEPMTIQGVVNKTMILLFILGASAWWVWQKILQSLPLLQQGVSSQAVGAVMQTSQQITPFLVGGVVGGFVLGLVTIFKKDWAAVTAPLYALCEGFVLGALSAYFEISYPGIVAQAVMLTFGVLFSLLLAYKSGFIHATENFKLGIVAATGGIAVFYFVTMILSFFKIQIPIIYASSPMGIAFSFFVVVIAALNLVLDFDFIEKGASSGAPKYMEWYSAFGLIVTLIWLYMEILRLLAKLRDNRR